MTDKHIPSPDEQKAGLKSGLRLVFILVAISCIMPLALIYNVLRNKPTYQHRTFESPEAFVQVTYQTKPVPDLLHVLVFSKKPSVYETRDSLEIAVSPNSAGFVVLPRGIFYNAQNIGKSAAKTGGDKKAKLFIGLEVPARTEIVPGKDGKPDSKKEHPAMGKCFIVPVPEGLQFDARDPEKFLDSRLWIDVLRPALLQFQIDLAAGKINLDPPIKTADWM
ncbi:MAG: hypothetical protein RL095_1039 [Verrucomicrobiota bacterium]|jgi:hypothetical protein